MIDSLQSLRGIFALMIFCHHFTINGKGCFEAGGSCGVAFFLVLSGYVMCAGYERIIESSRFDFKRYYLKRIVRVYPLHLLCLAAFVVLNLFSLTVSKLLILFPNLLLLQSWIPLKSIYFSGNAVSWCLSDLMFFYAVFPILVHGVLGCSCRKYFIAVSIALILYFSIAVLLPENLWHPLLYINPIFRLMDFVLGVMLWQVWKKVRNSSLIHHAQSSGYALKSLIEFFSVGLLVAGVLIYPLIEERFSFAALWWMPMLTMILVFTVFNNRGGYFQTY